MMRTSATGTSATEPRRAAAGFTLIEILVVVLIIGIMIVGVALSTTAASSDRELDEERDRIIALTQYLREQASLQAREFGMRWHVEGYEFVVLEAPTGMWVKLEDDSITRARKLPEGLEASLEIEGRRIVLPQADVLPDELTPQILLYSSGDLNEFELELRRIGGRGVRFVPNPAADRIEAAEIEADS